MSILGQIISDEMIGFTVDNSACFVVQVGQRYEKKGFPNGEAVAILLQRYYAGRTAEPLCQLYLTPENAHILATLIEANARAVAGLFEKKEKPIQ